MVPSSNTFILKWVELHWNLNSKLLSSKISSQYNSCIHLYNNIYSMVTFFCLFYCFHIFVDTDITLKENCKIPLCKDFHGQPNSTSFAGCKTQMLKSSEKFLLGNMIITIAFPIPIITGTISNFFSFVVFSHSTLKKHLVSLVLCALAITDMLALYIGAMDDWLKTLTGWNLSASSDISCKLYGYIYYVVSSISSWLLVVVSMERVIALAKPLQSRFILTRRNARRLIATIVVIIGFVRIPELIGGNKAYDRIALCDKNLRIYNIISYCTSNIKETYWIDFISRCVLPPILTFIFSISIILLLAKLHKHHITMSISINLKAEAIQMKRISFLLLVTTFVFLCLTLPYDMYIMYGLLYDSRINIGQDNLFYACANLFAYLNHSINFLLYCIALKRFRCTLLHIVNEWYTQIFRRI